MSEYLRIHSDIKFFVKQIETDIELKISEVNIFPRFCFFPFSLELVKYDSTNFTSTLWAAFAPISFHKLIQTLAISTENLLEGL